MASAASVKPAGIVKTTASYLVPDPSCQCFTKRTLSEFKHQLTFHQGKIKVTEWVFSVPLDHDDPSGKAVLLFARSAERAEPGHSLGAALSPSSRSASNASSGNSSLQTLQAGQKPWIYYLSGGPGGACPAPQDAGFVRFFVKEGYRVMLLDQRGAGLSSTLSARIIGLRGDAAAQADFLSLYRADNIVRDTEAVRRAVAESEVPDPVFGHRIALLGQSFGGFCSTTYLGMFPDSLREVFLTGGLPPMGQEIDDVYTKLVKRAAQRSKEYYEKFPGDERVAKKIVDHIREHEGKDEMTTLMGGKLSVARFRSIGMYMGGAGGFTKMHNLMKRMENDLETFGIWTRPTMSAFERADDFDDAVLYAILHEIIYLDGPGKASKWSAERMLAESPHFGKAAPDDPVNFTGEMITHDTFTDRPELRPLLEAAEILSTKKDWPRLYNEEALAKNKVPVFAAVYLDDLFVDFDFAMATASKIKGTKTFVTNRAYHDGIRADPNTVLQELLALRDNTMD